jgi:aconitate hydratase
MKENLPTSVALTDARILLDLGDFITTDHISPAGSIAPLSPAAAYLEQRGVSEAFFNTYGARRGNHEVMMRGTFANAKLQNKLAADKLGAVTYDFTQNKLTSIFEAAQNYAQRELDTVVLAGKMYGSGSSRDWAAKGPLLLGVRAVFAISFERIHRSNLIGMGILPLQFMEGESALSLGIDRAATISLAAVDFSEGLPDPQVVRAKALLEDGCVREFDVVVRVDTPTEGHYFINGGILPYVLRNMAI